MALAFMRVFLAFSMSVVLLPEVLTLLMSFMASPSRTRSPVVVDASGFCSTVVLLFRGDSGIRVPERRRPVDRGGMSSTMGVVRVGIGERRTLIIGLCVVV